MKFISKSANLHVILKPGLPAQPITGTPATATVSVRFQGGIANVGQEELVKMMLSHPGFNRDFISAEENARDPFAYLRKDTEPQHIIEEMRYGHPYRTVTPKNTELPPEIKKIIMDEAVLIAKEMLPAMVADTLKNIIKEREENKEKVESEKIPESISGSEGINIAENIMEVKETLPVRKPAGRPKKTEVVQNK